MLCILIVDEVSDVMAGVTFLWHGSTTARNANMGPVHSFMII